MSTHQLPDPSSTLALSRALSAAEEATLASRVRADDPASSARHARRLIQWADQVRWDALLLDLLLEGRLTADYDAQGELHLRLDTHSGDTVAHSPTGGSQIARAGAGYE